MNIGIKILEEIFACDIVIYIKKNDNPGYFGFILGTQDCFII